MLIDKECANRLKKSFLIEELSSGGPSVSNLKKAELVTLFLEKVAGNEQLQLEMIKKNPVEFALHPLALEEMLGISKTERSRWTKEAKLPVAYYEPFKKWGQTLEYPMYNYYEAIQIGKTNLIENWREEHRIQVNELRKASAKAAVRNRIRNQTLASSFLDGEWKFMIDQWYKENPVTGAALQLAFWTIWITRYAKEMKLKERNAVKKAAEYRDKKESFYKLKNEAIELLLKSPLCKLQFYQPKEPDKITDLEFCQHHYEGWSEAKKCDYISKYDYFWMNQKEIRNCPDCSFQIHKDHYSLFYLTITSEDIKFSFHIPYPLGWGIFPDKKHLKKAVHVEQEGLFRFGRGLLDEEKITFTEADILKYFQESVEKYKWSIEHSAKKMPTPQK